MFYITNIYVSRTKLNGHYVWNTFMNSWWFHYFSKLTFDLLAVQSFLKLYCRYRTRKRKVLNDVLVVLDNLEEICLIICVHVQRTHIVLPTHNIINKKYSKYIWEMMRLKKDFFSLNNIISAVANWIEFTLAWAICQLISMHLFRVFS